MVGSAICRQLVQTPGVSLVTRSRDALDLRDQAAVHRFFADAHIDDVYLAAAKVGGIHANNEYPADFIAENLLIQNNIILAAHAHDVQRLLFLGSSCIYPREAAQPIREEALLTGPLEPTNEPYAIAKIAGIKLCESYNRQYGRDYRSVMPTNLYGPNDNFHPENSHVIPGLMRRIHAAKVNGDEHVSVWGSGRARREFLHVDDMARACVHVMSLDQADYARETQTRLSHLNVGTGKDGTIRELAEQIAAVVGYDGTLDFDSTKPDGTPRKCLDIGRITRLGWQPKIALQTGLTETYAWWLSQDEARSA